MAKPRPVEGRTVPSREEALDPRVLVSRERVLTTTLDLLTEAGLDELTIDDISRRSRGRGPPSTGLVGLTGPP